MPINEKGVETQGLKLSGVQIGADVAITFANSALINNQWIRHDCKR